MAVVSPHSYCTAILMEMKNKVSSEIAGYARYRRHPDDGIAMNPPKTFGSSSSSNSFNDLRITRSVFRVTTRVYLSDA